MVIEQSKRATPGIVDQGNSPRPKTNWASWCCSHRSTRSRDPRLTTRRWHAIVIGDTPTLEAWPNHQRFSKNEKIKFLVNVSVLTTGFDAPHMWIWCNSSQQNPSVCTNKSLAVAYKLSPGKKECLVLDYWVTATMIFSNPKSATLSQTQTVEIITILPDATITISGARLGSNGFLLEHFGRKCQGCFTDEDTGEKVPQLSLPPALRRVWRHDNDIAARICRQVWRATLVDQTKSFKDTQPKRCFGVWVFRDGP